MLSFPAILPPSVYHSPRRRAFYLIRCWILSFIQVLREILLFHLIDVFLTAIYVWYRNLCWQVCSIYTYCVSLELPVFMQKSNSLCVKCKLVLLQHVNSSEMLMTVRYLALSFVWGFGYRLFQGSISTVYWIFKFSSTVLRNPGILVSAPGKQDVWEFPWLSELHLQIFFLVLADQWSANSSDRLQVSIYTMVHHTIS